MANGCQWLEIRLSFKVVQDLKRGLVIAKSEEHAKDKIETRVAKTHKRNILPSSNPSMATYAM